MQLSHILLGEKIPRIQDKKKTMENIKTLRDMEH